MTPYQLIKNNYYNYDSEKNNGVVSNFCLCSYDKRTNGPLVLNNKECINFELIRDKIDKNLKACDALFFVHNKERLLFVEFKNRDYFEEYNDGTTTLGAVVEQAASSLFIHWTISNGIYNYESVKVLFAVVLPHEKNIQLIDRDPFIFRALISGYFDTQSLRDKFVQKLVINIDNLLHDKYRMNNFRYCRYYIVMSNEFDGFIAKL